MLSPLFAAALTEIRPGLIFWQLITFVIVFFVLRKVAWGPILKLMGEREKQITDSIASAQRERTEAEKLLGEQKAVIAEARREAAEMVRKNQAEMVALRDQMKADARKQAEEEVTTARRQIAEERQKAVAEVKATAVELAILAAERLLGERLDDPRHRKLAEQFIDQLPSGPAPIRTVA